jgi:cell division protein FtsB
MGRSLVKWLIVMLGWVVVIRTGMNVVRLYKAGDRVVEAQKELEGVQQRNEELKRKLALVKTPEYMERLAREKLGYGKDGEVVVVIEPSELSSKSEIRSSKSELEPNWRKWRRLYLGF